MLSRRTNLLTEPPGERDREILRLRRQRRTFAQIAAEVDLSTGRVGKIVRRWLGGRRRSRKRSTSRRPISECRRRNLSRELSPAVAELLVREFRSGVPMSRLCVMLDVPWQAAWLALERSSVGAEVVGRRRNGESMESIARSLRLSVGTVRNWTLRAERDGRREEMRDAA